MFSGADKMLDRYEDLIDTEGTPKDGFFNFFRLIFTWLNIPFVLRKLLRKIDINGKAK